MSTNAETIENREQTAIKTGTLLKLRALGYHFVKRTFDIVFALVGCIGIIVLIPFVKIGNMITGDFAPIFYRTTRIGRGGQEVQIPQIPLYGRNQGRQICRGFARRNTQFRPETS